MFEMSIFPDDTLRPNAAIYQCEPGDPMRPCPDDPPIWPEPQ